MTRSSAQRAVRSLRPTRTKHVDGRDARRAARVWVAGVRCGIEGLGRDLLAHDANDALRGAIRAGELTAPRFADEVLILAYRVLLLFILDDKGLIAGEPLQRLLRELVAAAALKTEEQITVDRTAAPGLWIRLQALFDELHNGGGEQGPTLDGLLFAPSSAARCSGSALDNASLIEAIRAMILARGDDGACSLQRRAFDMQDLGSAYETLLALEPHLDLNGLAERRFRFTPAASSARKTSGAYYTPLEVVEGLLDAALEPALDEACRADDPERALLELRICDPACGSGNFLVAAARRVANRLQQVRALDVMHSDAVYRQSLRDVIAHCIYGVDLNPMAAELCRLALWLEAGDATKPLSSLVQKIKVGNALLGAPPERSREKGPGTFSRSADAWCESFFNSDPADPPATGHFFHWHLEFSEVMMRGGFDVIVGNPPFLNQLESATTTSRAAAALLRAKTNGIIRGYSDMASAFLFESFRLLRPGGRLALVQPQSLLAARDAQDVRRTVACEGSLTHLWLAGEKVFGASTVTCAPTIQKHGPRRLEVQRTVGIAFEKLPNVAIDMDELAEEETWAHLAAALWNVPEFHLPAKKGNIIALIAEVTADFRDQYYGLGGFIVEDAEVRPAGGRLDRFPALITSGLIDLAENRWGLDATRILKKRWFAPRIDRDRMEREGTLGPWITQRLVPKILIATQTGVIELIVDEQGELLPSVPTISVMPHDPNLIWHLAAALASPVATALALRHYGGAGLSADAIKLSARQVALLPLPEPANAKAWDAAALAFRAAAWAHDSATRRDALMRSAEASCAAFGVEGSEARALIDWWNDRHASEARLTTPIGAQ